MKNPKDIIARLGYAPEDATLYLVTLELGEAPASDIAKRAKLNRSTTYIHLKELEKKGVVSSVEQNGVQYFSAAEPRVLFELTKTALRQAEAVLPDLMAIAGTATADKPRVQYYEGLEGVKTVLEDTLTATEPIRAFGNADLVIKNLPDYYPDYVRRRVKAGIRTKAILNEGKVGEEFKQRSQQELREVRLVPISFEMPNEMKIYDGKVVIMSHAKPFGAVIIHDPAIARTQQSIHDMAWQFAGSIKKPSSF